MTASGDRVPYLYVAGISFCGSTLLAFLLNSHPRMASISEAHGTIPDTNFDTYRCSCGALFLQCPFYRNVAQRMEEAGMPFDLRDWQTCFRFSRHRLVEILFSRPLRNVLLERVRDNLVRAYPGYKSHMAQIARRNDRFARTVLEILQKDIYVDAQKDSIRIKFLEESGLFDLRVIHLVREVRGACSSLMRHNSGRDAAWAARVWRTQNMNVSRARRYVSPERWMSLRYDDLCADVQGTLDRISSFVGVEAGAVPQSFLTVPHHIIGNAMRLQNVGDVTRDESWRKRLSAADLTVIARIAGRTNQAFGHAWPESSDGS